VGTGAIREDADTQYLITHERRCSKRAFVDARGVKWGLCRLYYVSSPARARDAPRPPPPSPSAASSHHSLPPSRVSPALPLTRAWWVVCVRGVDAAPSEFHRWRVETLSSLDVEPGAGGVSAGAAALRVVQGPTPRSRCHELLRWASWPLSTWPLQGLQKLSISCRTARRARMRSSSRRPRTTSRPARPVNALSWPPLASADFIRLTLGSWPPP